MPHSQRPGPPAEAPLAGAGEEARRQNATGQAAAVAAAILFGTAYVATALAMRSFTPLAVAMCRGVIATLVLLPIVARMRAPGPFSLSGARAWRLIVLGVSGGLAFVVAMNGAVALAGATLAAFAASLSPILAAVLAPVVLGESLALPALSGFTIAIVGTGLLTQASTSDADARGVLAGLLASFCFAVFLVLSRRWSRRYELSGGAIALSVAATTAIGLLPVELLIEPGRLPPSIVRPDALIGLIWLGLAPGVAAQLLVVASVRRVETRSSAALLLISPVTTAVLAAALLGETLNEPQLLGAGLILTGVTVAAGFKLGPFLKSARRWLGDGSLR